MPTNAAPQSNSHEATGGARLTGRRGAPAVALALLLAAASQGACRRSPKSGAGATTAAIHPAQPGAAGTPAAAPAFVIPPPPPAPRGKQLAIIYSSNLLGEYEPCG